MDEARPTGGNNSPTQLDLIMQKCSKWSCKPEQWSCKPEQWKPVIRRRIAGLKEEWKKKNPNRKTGSTNWKPISYHNCGKNRTNFAEMQRREAE